MHSLIDLIALVALTSFFGCLVDFQAATKEKTIGTAEEELREIFKIT